MSRDEDGFPKMFDSVRHKCDLTVTTLPRCAVNIWTRTQWEAFPFHHIDYLWWPAISVDEKQEHFNIKYGEEWWGGSRWSDSVSVRLPGNWREWVGKMTGFHRRTCAVTARDHHKGLLAWPTNAPEAQQLLLIISGRNKQLLHKHKRVRFILVKVCVAAWCFMSGK